MPLSPDSRSAIAFGLLTIMSVRFFWLACKQYRITRSRYQLSLVVFTGTLTMYVGHRLIVRVASSPNTGLFAGGSWLTELTVWLLTIGLFGAVFEQELTIRGRG